MMQRFLAHFVSQIQKHLSVSVTTSRINITGQYSTANIFCNIAADNWVSSSAEWNVNSIYFTDLLYVGIATHQYWYSEINRGHCHLAPLPYITHTRNDKLDVGEK